jgi:hypothetical protein
METNILGFASAVATFLGVWIGHVSVRKIEREVTRLWIPTLLALLLGIGLEIASLLSQNLVLSTICGILGATLFVDALEIAVRQPKRVQKGHAPANPNNPRHVQILAAHPEASTIDWLDREPRNSTYTKEELISIREQSV